MTKGKGVRNKSRTKQNKNTSNSEEGTCSFLKLMTKKETWMEKTKSVYNKYEEKEEGLDISPTFATFAHSQRQNRSGTLRNGSDGVGGYSEIYNTVHDWNELCTKQGGPVFE